MTVKEKLAEYPMFDVAILYHGFTPFMRDYDVIVEAGGIRAGRYRFTHCSEAHLTTRVADKWWLVSWDDRFTDHQRWLAAGEPDGFVWGACWSMAYPGLSYLEDATLAKEWSERFQQPMHEVEIE